MNIKGPKGRGGYSAIVYKDGNLYVAENNVGTLIQKGAYEPTITEAAVAYVEAKGGGKVYVKGFWASVKSTGATRVVVEYQGLTRVDLPTLNSAIRIQRDGYLSPIAGAMFNLGIGTDTTPNSDSALGIFSYIHSDQTPGAAVRGNFYSILKIAPNANFYGWCYTAVIEDRGTTANDHVGFYASVKGGVGAGYLWGFACEVHDNIDDAYSYNVTTVGMEILNLKKNGGSTSVGLHIIAGGDQVHNNAIQIDDQETASWTRGIYIIDPTVVGIDIGGACSSAAIRIPVGNKIALEGTSTIFLQTNSSYTTFIQDPADEMRYNKSTDRFEFIIGSNIIGYIDATGFHNGAPP